MEFKKYLKLFKKYLLFVSALSVFGAVIGFFIAFREPTGQVASNAYLIKTSLANQTAYNYEGYYAQERARNFTDTLLAILKNPAFTSNMLRPGQSILIEKDAPQLISVRAFAETPEEAKSLLQKVETQTQSKLNELFDQQLSFEPISQPSIGIRTNLPKAAYATAGFLLGAAFALFVVTLKEYFAP